MTNLETGALVASLALLPLAFMVWLIATAPRGYQDETGWHPGDEHADDNWGV